MKAILTILAIVATSSTVLAANCPQVEELKAQQQAVEQELQKIKIAHEYVRSRAFEQNGTYSNSDDVMALSVELGTQSLNLTMKSARIQMAISEQILSCVRK